MRSIFIILLGICVIYDLYSRKIPAVWIWMCISGMAIYRIYILILGISSFKECIICMIPGIVLLLISYVGRTVGSGDGLLIIASGLSLEWKELKLALGCAFLIAGLYSAGYMLFIQGEKNARIPFVPFLFMGILISLERNI